MHQMAGEHGRGVTADNVPLLVKVLRLFVDSRFTRYWGRQFSLLQLLMRCKQIGSWAKAQELLKQGHSYLDRDGDGEACESLK